MQMQLDNWRVQVKKGYLELCILVLIRKHQRLYGLELLERLAALQLPLKEGTLYPMLSRMTEDKLLQPAWETEGLKGHPRKFYALTAKGRAALNEMEDEFFKMVELLKRMQQEGEST